MLVWCSDSPTKLFETGFKANLWVFFLTGLHERSLGELVARWRLMWFVGNVLYRMSCTECPVTQVTWWRVERLRGWLRSQTILLPCYWSSAHVQSWKRAWNWSSQNRIGRTACYNHELTDSDNLLLKDMRQLSSLAYLSRARGGFSSGFVKEGSTSSHRNDI